MFKSTATMIIAAAFIGAIPAVAQQPGTAALSRVVAGTYTVDTGHTQALWTVNHLGISPLSGAFGASGGTLNIDPAKPSAAKVNVTFTIADISTTTTAFTKHLLSADIFDAAKFPTATFTSTSVQVSGNAAKITGNLTLHGVTKPVTLDAKFFGAGANPITKKLNIGFAAKASIKRSDFGLGFFTPGVADQVDLQINAAFSA